MSRPEWNKDKTELTYVDEDRWLKETFNKDLNLIKRTTSWGEWTEHEYVEKGKAKGRIAVIRNSEGLVKTFAYDASGRRISRKDTEDVINDTEDII
jgi:YD repeat-containing protein